MFLVFHLVVFPGMRVKYVFHIEISFPFVSIILFRCQSAAHQYTTIMMHMHKRGSHSFRARHKDINMIELMLVNTKPGTPIEATVLNLTIAGPPFCSAELADA